MYKRKVFKNSSINSPNPVLRGETIEEELERFLNNGEPIADNNVPLLYTERKDGVVDAYNIRADKWDIALTATDRITTSYQARDAEKQNREILAKEQESEDQEDGKPESV